jgi:serine/threonine-protein kinase
MDPSIRIGNILLGKYRIERVLGHGGTGIVVAARDLELGELFAIKLLISEALETPQAAEQFLREARAGARLKGEHVVKIHDVGKLETGVPYVVMEHLEGRDLHEIGRRGPLPVADAVELMLQVCEAIAEAHAIGLAHRALSPLKLFLIRRPNGSPCIKVLDFGIPVAQDAADLTENNVLVGAPVYMPPEKLCRTKEIDPRSDLWAIGVILFELVTGRQPFTTGMMGILRDEPPPPSRFIASLPAWLDAVIGRCLQKRPEHRFQTADELASALRSQGRTDAAPQRPPSS